MYKCSYLLVDLWVFQHISDCQNWLTYLTKRFYYYFFCIFFYHHFLCNYVEYYCLELIGMCSENHQGIKSDQVNNDVTKGSLECGVSNIIYLSWKRHFSSDPWHWKVKSLLRTHKVSKKFFSRFQTLFLLIFQFSRLSMSVWNVWKQFYLQWNG